MIGLSCFPSLELDSRLSWLLSTIFNSGKCRTRQGSSPSRCWFKSEPGWHPPSLWTLRLAGPSPLTLRSTWKIPDRLRPNLSSSTLLFSCLRAQRVLKFDYQGFIVYGQNGVVFPKDTTDKIVGIGSFEPRLLTGPEYEDLADGDYYVVAYFRVDYVDVFGNPRWTTSCGWKGFKSPAEVNARACTNYANVDEN